MKKRFLFLALCMLALCGVQAQSDSTQTSANNTVAQPTDTSKYALLYVYRPRNMTGSAVGYDLHVDDSVVCRVKNNTKYVIKLYKEGPTRVWAKSEQKVEYNLKVKYGQSYYLKCSVKMGVMWGRPEFTLVYPDQGEVEYEAVKGRGKTDKDAKE